MKDKQNLILFPLQCIHFVVTRREQQEQQARCTQVSLRGRTDSSEKQSPCMDFGASDTQLFWGTQRIAGILDSREKTDLGTNYSAATQVIYSLLLLQKLCSHTCILPQSLEHTNQLYGCDLYRTTAQERCTLSSPTPSSPQPAVNDGRSSGETPRLL